MNNTCPHNTIESNMCSAYCRDCGEEIKDTMKYSLQELRDRLPEFIEEKYPKGVKDRGIVTVAITLYTIWLEKRDYGGDCEHRKAMRESGTMYPKGYICRVCWPSDGYEEYIAEEKDSIGK